ncbi:DUF6882 domain-containing protein [Phenylobacterium sp. J367]|uniref:DUF6882 domain-containing protein n=1 Tax=Phenylobacterium sp. J367 TaxID=2898435 RepID=UPI00215112B2|nr:DUF6882 domain-containing protein [Phenylobacterium sp. J367]MCR5878911.1 hypothetical protein [Phenylobacterium sp. J367]
MKAPDWYEAWCEDAFAAFTAKQTAITEAFRLNDWERYDYEADRGYLVFSDAGGARVVAEIQVLGTTGDDGWTWAWAQPEWPLQSVGAAETVRAFGEQNGIEELNTERLTTTDDLDGVGWMLAAIATRIVGAEGAYRTPQGLFLLITSLRFVS